MIELTTIAGDSIAEAFGADSGMIAFAEDAGMTNLERHDAKYHPHGYKDGDECKYRKLLERDDLADVSVDPENVDGETISPARKPQGGNGKKDVLSRMSDIFAEYADNLLRSEGWLKDNLGISEKTNRKKASEVLDAFGRGKIGKIAALDALVKLSDGLPKNAWKKGSGREAPSLWPSGGMTATGGAFSKYYHAQGKKRYTHERHDSTGLYKTIREFGKALAREEDVPGLSPFHKYRPRFVETGIVPDSLSDEQLKHFRWTANGSTYPTVGNVGGRNYIVKHGLLKEGIRKNADLRDHLSDEVAADRFIREAGLKAPVCKTFERDSGLKDKNGGKEKDLVKIAEYVDGGVGLAYAWNQASDAERDKIRQQVVDAYPIMSFLENVDAFKNDNVLVDRDWNVWFVDNGACFDWRAQGGKKRLDGGNRMASGKQGAPWFYDRNDPADPDTGFFGLVYAPDQKMLSDILSETTDDELIDAARKYDFEALAKTLPPRIGDRVMGYAKRLNAAVRDYPNGWD